MALTPAVSRLGTIARLRRHLLHVVHGALLLALMTSEAQAQFRKRALQLAFCAGAAAATNALSRELERFATRNARSLGTSPDSIRQYRRHIQIGTAAVLCLTGATLAGTVYGRLSERDMRKRREEIELAVNETAPVSREIALPESGYRERIVTSAEQQEEDGKTCKRVVATGAESGEPAVAMYCRKPGGRYELEAF